MSCSVTDKGDEAGVDWPDPISQEQINFNTRGKQKTLSNLVYIQKG